jgi:hypothetical protein
VLINRGDGTFRTPVYYPVGPIDLNDPLSVSDLAVGDFLGDGRLDLATVASSYDPYRTVVSILPGRGDGTFGAPTVIPYNAGGVGLAVGDFNGDGRLDLAIANEFTATGADNQTVSVLLNQGDGAFSAPISFTVGARPDMIAVGDFNGDGAPDLAVANSGGNTISVLLDVIDHTPPALAITAPTTHATLTSLQSFGGTAVDNPGGSGVAGVDLLIRRGSDGLFWNPSRGWTAVLTTFAAGVDVEDGTWTASPGTLPEGANLPAGSYTLWVYATDQAGNRSQAAIPITVVGNATPPAPAVFTAPTACAVVTGQTPVEGHIQENPGGSGIASVNVLIWRASDGATWTGSSATGWSTGRTLLAAILDGSGNWSVDPSSLPRGPDLAAGTYRIWAYAYDRAGNRSDSGIQFTVSNAGATGSNPPPGIAEPPAPDLSWSPSRSAIAVSSPPTPGDPPHRRPSFRPTAQRPNQLSPPASPNGRTLSRTTLGGNA